jgi:hypothetical protein
LGVSYLVCLGQDLWAELVALVEAEALPAVAAEEVLPEGASEAVETEDVQPETCEEEDRYYGSLDLAEIAPSRARRTRWAAPWQEDDLWGDLDQETRRRLKRLLGGA